MDKPSITVAIPATIEDAVGALNGIDALLTAKGWERAAIVYAFTEDRQGQRTSRSSTGGRLGINEFAALKIAGLTTDKTVAHYRNCWIEGGGDPNIGAGDTVELPTGKFPPGEDTNFGKRVSAGVASDTVRGWSAEAKAEAIKVLVEDPDITDEVLDEVAEKAEARIPRVTTPVPPPRVLGAESVVTEVGSLFGAAYDRVDDAIDIIEEAIHNGVQFESLEFEVLIAKPETLDEIFARYRKTVAMVQTETEVSQ